MKLTFRVHALKRMFERRINEDDIRHVLAMGEVIEEAMKCVICKQAETRPGWATVTLERDGLTFVIRRVPARVCPNCGEEYVDEAVTAQLLRDAENIARAGTQVEIREFVAA